MEGGHNFDIRITHHAQRSLRKIKRDQELLQRIPLVPLKNW
jgi:hypothetical protein